VGRLSGFRYREITRRLKALGFVFDRQAAGSHEIWYNSTTNRYTTVPNQPRDMPEGSLRAILKQAGIDPNEFLGKLTSVSWWQADKFAKIKRTGVTRGWYAH
jgi:predicted RNA binding protein YcfA (HicA-like mRNA interferase family)